MKLNFRRISSLIFLAFFTLLTISPSVYALGYSPTVSLSTYVTSTAADVTLTFTPTETIAAGGYFVWDFPDGVDTTGWSFIDVDYLVNGTNKTLANGGLDPSGINNFGTASQGLIYIYLDSSGSALSSGNTVVVKIGSNATHQSQGTTIFTNGSAGTATYRLSAYTKVNANTWQKLTTDADNMYDVTITAATPEFSTIIYILTLIIGGAFFYHKTTRKGLAQ